MKNYCKTANDLKMEFEEIRSELPKAVLDNMEDDDSPWSYGDVLYAARRAQMHRSSGYNAAPYKGLKEALDRHGYLRHDLGMTLRILNLYSALFGEYGYRRSPFLYTKGTWRRSMFDKYDVFSCSGDHYENLKSLSSNQVASVRKFIKKTLSPEEAFVIEKYWLDCDMSLKEIAKQLNIKYSAVAKLQSGALEKLASTGVYHQVYCSTGSEESYKNVFMPSMPAIFDVISESKKAEIEATGRLLCDVNKERYDDCDRKRRERLDERADAFEETLIEELEPLLYATGSKTQKWAFGCMRKLCLGIIDWQYSIWYENGVPKMRTCSSRMIWTGSI